MDKQSPMLNKTLVIGVIILFFTMCYIPCISGAIDKSRNKETANDYNNSPLEVTITKPQNGIYCNNLKILPFIVPLILCGAISIWAEVVPDDSGMDRIEFYINDLLQETIQGGGPEYEFSLTWGPFSKINVKVIAYTFNETASDEITIWRIFK